MCYLNFNFFFEYQYYNEEDLKTKTEMNFIAKHVIARELIDA